MMNVFVPYWPRIRTFHIDGSRIPQRGQFSMIISPDLTLIIFMNYAHFTIIIIIINRYIKSFWFYSVKLVIGLPFLIVINIWYGADCDGFQSTTFRKFWSKKTYDICLFSFQNFNTVPVKEAGTFFNGDSYIVYNASLSAGNVSFKQNHRPFLASLCAFQQLS